MLDAMKLEPMDPTTPRGLVADQQLPPPALALGLVLGALGKTQTVFIHKLYDMLHDQSISHLIWWLPLNDLFCLLPGEDFSKVLAQYFKHTNIALFIRQLNMYGFHKVNDTFQSDFPSESGGTKDQTSAAKWEFRHLTNQFRKGDVELLKLIKRRLLKNVNSHKEIVNLLLIPPTLTPMEYYPTMVATPMVMMPQQMAPPPGVIPQPPPVHFEEEQREIHRPTYVAPGSPQLPGPHGLAPGSILTQGGILQRPSLVPQNLFERSLNFRFTEVNNQVGQLRNELAASNQRNELLIMEVRRCQQDSLKMLDLLEKYLVVPATSAPDRLNNKTPVNKVTPGDVDQSPMLKAPKRPSFENEIYSLRTAIHQRLGAPHSLTPPPPSNPPYHLSKLLRQSLLTQVSIVPQAYPLNPNYALYQKKLQLEGSALRHRLVFMDPLQPIPSRKNLTILIDELATTPASAPTNTTPVPVGVVPADRLRQELKLYLPLLLTVPQRGPSPHNPHSPSNPLAPGFPFPQVEKHRNLSASLLCSQLTRTNSLPVALVGPEYNPNYHYQQRNSFTSIYDQRRAVGSQTLVPQIHFNVPPTANVPPPPVPTVTTPVPPETIPQQLVIAQATPVRQHLPQGAPGLRPPLQMGKLPLINPIRLILPTNGAQQRIPSPLLTMLPRLVPPDAQGPHKEKLKNTLPLVLELDKLIKLASQRPYIAVNPGSERLPEGDREFKKRKVNETPV